MSRYSRSSFGGFGPGGWTPAVRTLIIVCSIAYLLQIFDWIAGGPTALIAKFGLTPEAVTHRFYLWQLVTYIFLHSPEGVLHILFNMLGLWMFGTELERLWGTKEFTKFFFICGIGAALTTVLLSPNSTVTTIGASGAIYGILLAYGLLFPDRIIIFIIFQLPAKYFVLILGTIEFFASLTGTGGGVAHIAHLGGLLFGFLYLRGGRIFPDLRTRYDKWQRARLRRKFEVYYNDRHREDDEKYRRWKN